MICSKFLSVCQLCETQGWVGFPFPRMIASDSHSQIMGMDFFIRFPFLNYENVFFSFPSRSRNMGIFFSFPSSSRIVGMDFFHSRICYFTDENRNINWITVRDTRLPFFQLPLHFSKQLYWGGKLSQDVQKWVTEKTGHYAQFCCK